jgi:hypothetical protein
VQLVAPALDNVTAPDEELRLIDREFPPPTRKRTLETL